MDPRGSARGSGSGADDGIDRLSFDEHRIPRSSDQGSDGAGLHGLLRDDVSLLSIVVEGVIEHDRQRLRQRIIQYTSFVSAVLCWYVLCLTCIAFTMALSGSPYHQSLCRVDRGFFALRSSFALPAPL